MRSRNLIARINLTHFTFTSTYTVSLTTPVNSLHLSLTIPREKSTSITARYTHQNRACVVPPEDGQVMPETFRGFGFS
jgi:hypothetical protein